MRLAILGLCLLAACVPAYSMASGTMDCIQGLVTLNKGVCLAKNLTSCSSECQEALEDFKDSTGVTPDCYDTMELSFTWALNLLGDTLEDRGVPGVNDNVTFDSYWGEQCGLEVTRNDTDAKPDEVTTVTCYQTLIRILGNECSLVTPTSCPSECKEALNELESGNGITRECYDTWADTFVSLGFDFNVMFGAGCGMDIVARRLKLR